MTTTCRRSQAWTCVGRATRAASANWDDDELRVFWAAAEGIFGDLCRVALMTAQRKEKVATMKWSDLDPSGVWTIAREPREKGHAGFLQLPNSR